MKGFSSLELIFFFPVCVLRKQMKLLGFENSNYCFIIIFVYFGCLGS